MMPNAMQPPTVDTMTPTMAKWDEQFRLFGKVRFGHKTLTVMIVLLMALLAMAAGVYFGIRDSGSVDTSAIVILLIVIAIVAAPAIYFFVAFRKKSVTVETDGIRLTNGFLLPWDGIEFAGVWSYRSNRSVAIQLTDDAMRAYKAQQSAPARMLTRTNAALTSSNAVFLPGTLDANPEEFSAWVTFLREERRTRALGRDQVPFA